jgi:hypothetical protein
VIFSDNLNKVQLTLYETHGIFYISCMKKENFSSVVKLQIDYKLERILSNRIIEFIGESANNKEFEAFNIK